MADSDWTLTPEQFAFITALITRGIKTLDGDAVMITGTYHDLFGDMSIDEAIDRYQSMTEGEHG